LTVQALLAEMLVTGAAQVSPTALQVLSTMPDAVVTGAASLIVDPLTGQVRLGTVTWPEAGGLPLVLLLKSGRYI